MKTSTPCDGAIRLRSAPSRDLTSANWRPHALLALFAAIAAFLGLGSAAQRASAEIVMPGYQVEVYATIDDPGGLTFDPLGNLYVGHIWNYRRIHRVSPDGSSVEEYGNIALGFPHTVAWDAQGTMSGVPGSLLVSTDVWWGAEFYISAILPNEQVLTVLGPGDGVSGVFDMIFDDTGRLLLVEGNWSGNVWVIPDGSINPTPLVSGESGTGGYGIAMDQSSHLYVSEALNVPGSVHTIRVYDSDGQMIDDSFAQLGPRVEHMVFGPGGALWGTDLYVIDEAPNHQLLRLDSLGTATVIGTGFGGNTTPYIAFGPDGALYVSHNEDGVIYRVSALPEPPPGDFNGDGILDIEDLRMLSAAIADGSAELQYDVDHSGLSDLQDRRHWVTELRKTWIGDANLDGQFNSTDFVEVFQAGKFETNNAAGWRHGDWDGDWRCTTSDFVMAFQDGGYEQGPRTALAAVPEPGASMLLVMGLLPWLLGCRLFQKVAGSLDLCHQRTNSEGTHCRRAFTRILVLSLLSAIGWFLVPSAQANFFWEDFEGDDINAKWVFSDTDLAVVDGRVQATDNGRFIESKQEFYGPLRVEFDIEKVGMQDHSTWDYIVWLTALPQNSQGVLLFDTEGRDAIRTAETQADWISGSQVNRGTATYTYQDGSVQFAFTNADGVTIQSKTVFVGNYGPSKLQIAIAAFSDSPRIVDNVRVISMPEPRPSQPGVFRWDNNQLIPGTEGITVGPGVQLNHRDLAFASLWRQDLTGSRFDLSNLTSAYLSESILTGASLNSANLTSVNLNNSKLTSADLTGANLSQASLHQATLIGARLAQADLTSANLQGATFINADLTGANLAHARLNQANLVGAHLTQADLTSANLHGAMLVTTELVGADLTGADLSSSVLTNANLTGANLTNAFLRDAVDVQTAVLTSTTIYNQWTRFPDAFDPMTHGLTLSPSALGDVNANDAYDVTDLDMLTSRLGGRGIGLSWLPDAAFDLNNDTNIDLEDHRIWVQDLKHTWFGDADLNGLFDSADYVQVFVAGRYRTGQIAGWAEGDWDGDGLFDSSDFVIAFVDGGYEQGPRGSLAAVPEPATAGLMWVGASLLALRVGFRRHWYWMGAVGVLVAIGIGDGTSSALGAVLFEDHFTEGMSPEWVSVKPVQWVEDGWLMTQADGSAGLDSAAFVHDGDTTWTDYQMSVWVDPILSWGSQERVDVFFRTSNIEPGGISVQGEYYRLHVTCRPVAESHLWLRRMRTGDDPSAPSEHATLFFEEGRLCDGPAPTSAESNAMHYVVSLTGPRIRVSIDGAEVIDIIDPEPLLHGGVGVGATWDLLARFDDVVVTPHGLNELVWNGKGPGSWDSASWSRPDGTPTTEIPDLNTITTVASHRVAVDGPAGGQTWTLSVVDSGEVAVGQGGTLTVAGDTNVSGGATLSLANNAVLLAGARETPPSAVVRSTALVGRAAVTFGTGSSGLLGDVVVDPAAFNYSSARGSLLVQSGARVTAMNTSIGATEGPDLQDRSTLTVSGADSTYTQTGDSTLTIGSSNGAGVGTGTLNVARGGSYTSGTGNVLLGASGTINLDGGTLNLAGPLVRDGGVLNFNSGALSIVDDLTIGADGLLGVNVTLAANRHLTTSATTFIDPFNTLSLNGGTLSTGLLVNHGTIDFQRGTLAITGGGGFRIGTGALGSYVALGTGTNLQVTHTTTIEAGALLQIEGGGFAGNNIGNDGTIDHRDGSLDFAGTLENSAAGRLFVGGVASPAGSITNAGRITMHNSVGLLGGAGAITNTGLITGDGTIAKPLTNRAAGQVRAAAGKTLTFTGPIAANEGTFSLQGGTLEFTSGISNAARGVISGEGFLITEGLTNHGNLAFSGDTGVFGDVVNVPGGHIVTSSGATTTFYDDVVHDGVEVRTGAGCQTVFLGAASGAGPFTGTGTVYFEGDLRPGLGPGVVSFGGDVILGAVFQLTMDIAGPSAGSQYDRLEVAGRLALSGTLHVDLVGGFAPALGDRFDLFDSSSQIGVFSAVELPSLPHGLVWDRSSLYTDGMLSLVAAPLPGEGDYNGNGHLDVGDLDLQAAVGIATQDLTYDLNGDSVVDYVGDRVMWLHQLKNVYVGDANLDLEFNSGDMVQVFQRGKYETALVAGWAEGDWDASGTFDSSDFVVAFQDGGYEMGPRTNLAAVPEPGTLAILLTATCFMLIRVRTASPLLLLILPLFLATPSSTHADIYRWDTGEVIPRTEGITPGPGVKLSRLELEYAELSDTNLTGAHFQRSHLSNASFARATLVDANLTMASLNSATFKDADSTGAVVTGADLGGTTSRGFTQAQLSSTSSYRAKDLQSIGLGGNDLTGWDFSGQNLTSSNLGGSTLTHANLSGANLVGASLFGATLTGAVLTGANLNGAGLTFSTLTDADLTGAVITGVDSWAGWNGEGTRITQAQLESTASYRAKDLQGIKLWHYDLTEWDLGGVNLSNAILYNAILTNANLTEAVVTGASFTRWDTGTGLTRAQLESTASYQAKDLRGIGLDGSDLKGCDLRGQNLSGAGLRANLTDANLAEANLSGAGMSYSMLRNANLSGTNLTSADIRWATLTNANLTGANLTNAGGHETELSNANLSGANLTGASLWGSTLTRANLSGANLAGASLVGATLTDANLAEANLTNANLSGTTLTGAVLTGAMVMGTDLGGTTSRGFTQAQLSSTSSYQARNLQGIALGGNDLKGWDLSGQDLTNARLGDTTLTDANLTGAVVKGTDLGRTTSRGFDRDQLYSTASYQAKDLRGIWLGWNDLTGWDFSGQDLTRAHLDRSTLANADLTGAVVSEADFSESQGFTSQQLYSTVDYQAKNLQGIGLSAINLGGWDFSGQNLANARLSGAILTNANLTGANLTSAYLGGSTMNNANLTGAVVIGGHLGGVTTRGFTNDQLYSTVSYQEKDLRGIELANNDLTRWDFSGQNLTNASFAGATLSDANLTGAVVTGVNFSRGYDGSGKGMTREQLASTASYQAKDLTGVVLENNDLAGWDFSGQNLTGAVLFNSTLSDASLTGAVVIGADFSGSDLTKEQLYSTASYQAKTLQGIRLIGNDLSGWDLAGQDLRNSSFGTCVPMSGCFGSDLTNANLIGADLRNANFGWARGVESYSLDSTTVCNQWTDLDLSLGATLVMSPAGDLDANDALDAVDIDQLANRIRGRDPLWSRWLPDAAYDLNGDNTVDLEDHRVWVKDLNRTWFGDADLNGEFKSNDFVQVFQAGKYETQQYASWAEGDWNGDGLFDSADFITAFQDGGYEQGPRTDAAAVPEPGAWTLLAIGLVVWLFGRRTCAT